MSCFSFVSRFWILDFATVSNSKQVGLRHSRSVNMFYFLGLSFSGLSFWDTQRVWVFRAWVFETPRGSELYRPKVWGFKTHNRWFHIFIWKVMFSFHHSDKINWWFQILNGKIMFWSQSSSDLLTNYASVFIHTDKWQMISNCNWQIMVWSEIPNWQLAIDSKFYLTIHVLITTSILTFDR